MPAILGHLQDDLLAVYGQAHGAVHLGALRPCYGTGHNGMGLDAKAYTWQPSDLVATYHHDAATMAYRTEGL